MLESSLAHLDLPVIARVHQAAGAGDQAAVLAWSALLRASRPTAELQAEDRHLGRALGRVLAGLDVAGAAAFGAHPDITFAALFAVGARAWEITVEATMAGYAFAWAEAQVGAALRLAPLGQSAGQRILAAAIAVIPGAVATARAVPDDEIGASAPAQAIASARHETQYSRLFRS